jgi:HAE1 family hydrophobic/amphiphilic exporter-1
MTSLAFILGVLPLVLAQGAGRISRRSVGTTVFGGMIAATFLNLVFIPVLYVLVRRIQSGFKKEPPSPSHSPSPVPSHPA